MSDLITIKHLEDLIFRLNALTNSPQTPYTRIDGGVAANIGNYHLSSAYGGYALQRMENESGGVSCHLYIGHVSKRELYTVLNAFVRGIEEGKADK